jgi:hypothetical protein
MDTKHVGISAADGWSAVTAAALDAAFEHIAHVLA